MKSIKPGRGPSMMGGVAGIFMICFGVLWTVLAAQSNIFFALFGVIWTGIAIVQTVYNFKNATGKNRYSSYDITDANEEPDPFEKYHTDSEKRGEESGGEYKEKRFCPYCGAKTEPEDAFCASCGNRLKN